jgi:hypothetical protein
VIRKIDISPAQASNEVVLPERVQEALGQLVGSAKEGLLALNVGVGLGVLAELLEEEVVEVVGAKGKHDPERTAVPHGHESGEVTLGGRRAAVERPRVRSADADLTSPSQFGGVGLGAQLGCKRRPLPHLIYVGRKQDRTLVRFLGARHQSL